MSLKEFIQENESGSFNDVKVDFVKWNLNESKELIVLSRVQTSEGFEIPEQFADNYSEDYDMIYYSAMSKWGFELFDTDGKKSIVNLPVLDEAQHNIEKSKNEFFNMVDVIGLQKFLEPKFLLFVMDADKGTIHQWSAKQSNIESLIAIEDKYGSLLGRTITVSKGKQKTDSLVISPFGIGRSGWVDDIYDINLVTYPNKIVDNVWYRSIDSQIRYFNRYKDSMIKWMIKNDINPTENFWEVDVEGNKTIKEWFFTIDDENMNGVLKPQFMKIRSSEFEV